MPKFSYKLNDNARRDWFKIDEESIKLRQIIVEFMKRLTVPYYEEARLYFKYIKKDMDFYELEHHIYHPENLKKLIEKYSDEFCF